MPIKKLDRGHQESDDQLKELEKQLEKEYKNAYNEMRAKTNGYLRQFKEQEAAKLKLVKAGELSESDYLDWRRRQMLLGHQFDELVKDLSYDMTHTNEIATAMINGNAYQAFADNHNYGAYEVCKGTGEALRFDIYNKEAVERLVKDNPKLLPKSRVDIAKDMRWNERHIRSALTQGILQGDSIPNIAQRLKQVTTMSDSAAVRNARTMTTAAESAGRMEAYKEAEEMGIEMEKVWIATLDDRTRDAHVELDGQAVPLDAYFVNSIGKIFEPADPNADPENVYNCRCTMISQVKGRPKDLSGRAMSDSLGDMTYDEWKAAAAERQAEENNVPLDEIEQDPAPREDKETIEQDARSIIGLEYPERPRQADFGGYTDEYIEARDAYKAERERIDGEIDKAVNASLERTAFENHEQLKAWADENDLIIDKSVYEQIDIRAFNEAKPALEEMFERFPEVKSYNIEMDGDVIKTGFEINTTNDGYMSANNGLNFNPAYFGNGNYEEGLKHGYDLQISGWTVRGDGTIETMVKHEFGHNVQEYIENSIREKYHYSIGSQDWRKHFSSFDEFKENMDKYHAERDAFDKELLSLAQISGASEYSNTNSMELFAEGFAEYTSGANTEFGIKFGEFLERWYR